MFDQFPDILRLVEHLIPYLRIGQHPVAAVSLQGTQTDVQDSADILIVQPPAHTLFVTLPTQGIDFGGQNAETFHHGFIRFLLDCYYFHILVRFNVTLCANVLTEEAF
ncbi:hypothetical protein J5A58_05225 [Prevotella melaninogenica]|uniref:Uncharacterized protein n=1 Tax=Prevotella melaninogenica TaxID=28132 RepID=A0ABX7XMT5_9BACT|nr:hypothetical protein J5A58_05225 [Prevotella melaninogenica]